MEKQDFINRIIETISITIDYYQNKIETYNKDLLKVLNKAIPTRKQKMQDFILKEKELSQLYINNNNYKEEVKSRISFLKEEMAKNIDLYCKELNLQGEIQKTIHLENDHYKGIWLGKKKKRQELNHKINSLERDYNQKMKELEDNKIYEGKQYKARVNEEIRKMNIDLQRVNLNTTKAYNVIEKELLDINDNKGINESKKRIKEIRKVGLDEQENLKIQYYEVIYNHGINFANLKMSIEDEIAKTTFEYNEKMNTLKLERLQMELEEKRDNLLHLNEVEKKAHQHLMELKTNEHSNTKKEKSIIKEEEERLYNDDYQKDNEFYNLLREFEKDTITFDKVQVNTLSLTLIDEDKLNSHYYEIKNVFISLIKSAVNAIIDSLEVNMNKRFGNYQKILGQFIHNLKHKKLLLPDSFNEYNTLFIKELEKEIEKEKSLFYCNKERINNYLQEIIDKINLLFKEVNNFNIKEKEANNEFIKTLESKMDEVIEDIDSKYQNKVKELYDLYSNKKSLIEKEMNLLEENQKNELSLLNNDSSIKINKITQDIEDTLKQGQKEKDDLDKENKEIITKLTIEQKNQKDILIKNNEKEKIDLENVKKIDIKVAKQETIRKKKTL